jgi:hypothetical protein
VARSYCWSLAAAGALVLQAFGAYMLVAGAAWVGIDASWLLLPGVAVPMLLGAWLITGVARRVAQVAVVGFGVVLTVVSVIGVATSDVAFLATLVIAAAGAVGASVFAGFGLRQHAREAR